jgi:protein-S-isoprenylcysteine O-methyltransferase Ste14
MLWVIYLMITFQNYSTGMFVYLFLHGSYGIAWVWKDLCFPDASFQVKGTLGSLVVLSAFLGLYWCISLPLAAGYGVSNPPLIRIILVITMYLGGLYLMLGSDHQKNLTLARQKGTYLLNQGLISTGFFKNTRNPNYLGEVFIYGSFAICAGHYLSYLVFFCGSCLLFSINIYLKEKMSYEKKAGW